MYIKMRETLLCRQHSFLPSCLLCIINIKDLPDDEVQNAMLVWQTGLGNIRHVTSVDPVTLSVQSTHLRSPNKFFSAKIYGLILENNENAVFIKTSSLFL
jgi:hypothetical protein